MKTTVGQRIKEGRGEISQSAFVKILGVSKAQVSYMENEKSGFSLNLLIKIAQACNVSIDWLLTGKESLPVGLEPHEDYITMEEDEFMKLLKQINTLNDQFRFKF